MGVLNVTPDSFSDGGRFLSLDSAIRQAEAMVEQGALIIDVGGESTRPGASAVAPDEELRRVIPVIERLARLPVVVSVDSSKALVIKAAVEAGAGLVNDVQALRAPGSLAAAAAGGAAVCLMHMQGEPPTMQQAPAYLDTAAEVADFLRGRVQACLGAGICADRIAIDPGFGFGKTLEHNLELLRRLPLFAGLGVPVLVGLSRKSMIGALTGRAVDERLAGSLAAALLAADRGAHIIRTHDVGETLDALRVWAAVSGG